MMYIYVIMEWHTLSDKAIIRELGNRIKITRLDQNLTQAQLAEKAGVHRTTLGLIERGQSTSVISYIQILRALDGLDVLNDFLMINKGPSPMQVLEEQAKYRKRASGKKKQQEDESEW